MKKSILLPVLMGGCLGLGVLCNAAMAADAADWQSSDIGEVGAAGSFKEANGVFTVSGSGKDIWDQSDAFRFVCQTLNGSGTITAHVSKFDAQESWAKAGLMIRETLASASTYGMVFASRWSGTAFQLRHDTAAAATNMITASRLLAPCWLRLVRQGDIITAYCSKDADAGRQTWLKMGSIKISMSDPVYIGMAVCSKKDGTLCEAQFDHVTVVSSEPPK